MIAPLIAQTFWDSFLEWLSGSLGEATGKAAAYLIESLLYLLVSWVFWGSIAEQLISKAGFKGKGYRRLLVLLWAPVVGSLSLVIFGEYSDITTAVGIAAVVSAYLGLAILAFFPWPVYRTYLGSWLLS